MCGIAGIISPQSNKVGQSILKLMITTLAHRGPDGEGIWINKKNNCGLAHRRLAIIDLSDEASQPMHYMNRYSIVFNGEIYNYPEIKKDLQKAGYSFNTASDTEVILAAYDCYRERCLQYFDGMFSFALWDEKQQTLFIARDRFGEKPFYYHLGKNTFSFASEMKALWAAGIPKDIDQKMLLNYLSLGNVQNPANKAQTFYLQIHSLPPAHYAVLQLQDMRLQVQPYWDIDKQHTQKLHDDAILHKLELLLRTSIGRRLRSDVPLGSSLSGGLDSSTIIWFVKTILQNSRSASDFCTFSASFPGFDRDEKEYIQEASQLVGFTNYTVTPSPLELIHTFEKLLYHQEEPFPSSSIFAQYKVYELAAQKGVKVLLDGQGADEILAGYHRYLHWYLQEMAAGYKFAMVKKEKFLLKQNKAMLSWGYKNYIAAMLPSHAALALERREYRRIVNNPDITHELMRCVKGREWDGIHKPIITKLNDILYFNTMQMGMEELLRYADRNSMAHGIEVRLPFLQADLVKFIFSLPSSQKINNGYGKWILRSLMDTRLPASIVWRKDKVGFEPPQKEWMSSATFTEYLAESKRKLINEKILKPSVIHKKSIPLDAYESNNCDWRYICASHLF